jgi:acyl transferase domain-containing protein
MFPGQGTQYVGMSRELYETEPLFRDQLDRCAELLIPHLNLDLRDVIYPTDERREEASRLLTQTYLTQPALFIVEYALARLLMAWGVEPAAMIGHSVGEYVAACLAGVFSLEDALALVAARGSLIQQLPAGQMLAVQLPEAEVKELLGPRLSLAVVNTPKSCVIAGSPELVQAFQNILSSKGIHSRLLQTSHAFHSEMLEPVMDEFAARVSQVNLQAPAKPFISNVTGTWITAAETTDPNHWVRHLRQTVRFAEGLGELLRQPDFVLMEVGPGHTLSRLAKQHPDRGDNREILTSLPDSQKGQSEMSALLTTVGRLWLAGGTIDWTRFNSGKQRRRVPLPTYPFERKRHYVEPQTQTPRAGNNGAKSEQAQSGTYLYLPSWKRVALGACEESSQRREGASLLFVDECGLGSELAKRLAEAGETVVTVKAGDRFIKVGESDYTINARQAEDYQALLKTLAASGVSVKTVVHLWSITDDEDEASTDGKFARAQESGLNSLLFLTQALAKNFESVPLKLLVVTNNVQEVDGEELLRPEKATVLAACKVIPQEHPKISCRSIDVSMTSTRQRERVISQLFAELNAESCDGVVAYRGRHRWLQTFEPIVEQAHREQRLRERGVYAITDGLSRDGMAVARFLAETVHPRLVLLTSNDSHDGSGLMQELKRKGAEVLVLRAELSDEEQMRQALATVKSQFGELNGVIHIGISEGTSVKKKIVELPPSDCERQLQTATGELMLLEKILAEHELDSCLVFSSLSSVLGGPNCTTHVASSIFTDVMVQAHNQRNGENWISINWDTTEEHSMSEVLSSVLSLRPTSQVLISSTDLEARLIDSRSSYTVEIEQPVPQSENEKEAILANIWQDLLGIKQVGADDNFFDLDGHSLLGTMMLSRIRKSFGVDLEMTDIFNAPTIRELSLLIAQRAVEHPDKVTVTTVSAAPRLRQRE